MVNFKLHILLLLLLVITKCLAGQSQNKLPLDIIWSTAVGGDRDDSGEQTVVDLEGNIYIVGSFEAQIEVPDLSKNLVSKGAKDIFILKFNEEGRVINAIAIGGIGNDKVNDIEIGADNNIYIGGYYENELSILGSEKKHRSVGGQDVFWAILNTDLELINSFSAGGKGNAYDSWGSADEEILNIHYNSINGRIIINGYLRNDIDLDSLQNDDFKFTTRGFADVFTACFDIYGNCIWAHTINLISITTTYISELDSEGNIVVGGVFDGTCDFDPSTKQVFLTSSQGSKDIFLAKYSPSGDLINVNKIGGTGLDQLYDLKLDTQNNATICGYFNSLVDFDITNGQKILKSNGEDGFIASYNNAGQIIFAERFKATSDHNYHLAIDNKDLSIYLSGSFLDVAEFNHPENSFNSITSTGKSDIFICHYYRDGKFDYALSLGHTESEFAASIAIHDDNLYLAGLFRGSQTTIATTDNVMTFTNKGRNDALIISLKPSASSQTLFTLSGRIRLFENLREPCEIRVLEKNSDNESQVVRSILSHEKDFIFYDLKPGKYTLMLLPQGTDTLRYNESYYVEKATLESANWFTLFGNTSEVDIPLIANGKNNRIYFEWVTIYNLYPSESNIMVINGSKSIKEKSNLKIFDSRGILVYEKLFHAQEIIGIQHFELPIVAPGIYTGVIENSEFEPRRFKFLNQN